MSNACSGEDIEFLYLVAGMLGIALDNERASEEIKRLEDRLEKVKFDPQKEIKTDDSVIRKVKLLLMSRIDRGPCELAEVARSLYMSVRTLQRRLAKEASSFSATVDSLRRELCLHHLEKENSALAEIAYVAGFSDTSALTRAVRRWTGQTPLAFRRSHAGSSKGKTPSVP